MYHEPLVAWLESLSLSSLVLLTAALGVGILCLKALLDD